MNAQVGLVKIKMNNGIGISISCDLDKHSYIDVLSRILPNFYWHSHVEMAEKEYNDCVGEPVYTVYQVTTEQNHLVEFYTFPMEA